MTWTDDEKIAYFLRLPWTIVPEVTPDGDRVVHVAEIPSATGTGRTDEELEADFWESLRESLRAYLHFGDPIPVPPGTRLPWEQPPRLAGVRVLPPESSTAASSPPSFYKGFAAA